MWKDVWTSKRPDAWASRQTERYQVGTQVRLGCVVERGLISAQSCETVFEKRPR